MDLWIKKTGDNTEVFIYTLGFCYEEAKQRHSFDRSNTALEGVSGDMEIPASELLMSYQRWNISFFADSRIVESDLHTEPDEEAPCLRGTRKGCLGGCEHNYVPVQYYEPSKPDRDESIL